MECIIIVQTEDDRGKSLETKVKEAMADGWEPVGGLAIVGSAAGSRITGYQAMARRDHKEK